MTNFLVLLMTNLLVLTFTVLLYDNFKSTLLSQIFLLSLVSLCSLSKVSKYPSNKREGEIIYAYGPMHLKHVKGG